MKVLAGLLFLRAGRTQGKEHKLDLCQRALPRVNHQTHLTCLTWEDWIPVSSDSWPMVLCGTAQKGSIWVPWKWRHRIIATYHHPRDKDCRIWGNRRNQFLRDWPIQVIRSTCYWWLRAPWISGTGRQQGKDRWAGANWAARNDGVVLDRTVSQEDRKVQAWDWQTYSGVKSTECCLKALVWLPAPTLNFTKVYITPVPGNLMLSSDLSEHQACI